MLSYKNFLLESKDRYLHGTLIDHIPDIKKNWLQPKVGKNVETAYGEYKPEPALFFAHQEDVEKAHAAIINHIGFKLDKHPSKVSGDDIEKHGALVIHTPKNEWGKPHLYDPDRGHKYERDDRPVSAESGDYYSFEDHKPTGILTGKRLRAFFKKRDLTD